MSGVLSNLESILIRPTRAIASIIPDCAVEESHSDRLQITRQPVEIGAAISDHAFKVPSEVQLRWGWSNSSPANALASGFGPLGLLGFGSETYVQDIYAQLLTLQVSAIPFVLITGKRAYANMLLEDIAIRTDESSEYSLLLTARCVEIIIVSTQSATVPAADQPHPTNAATQALPQQTSPTQNAGTVQPTPQPSLLYQGGMLLGATAP